MAQQTIFICNGCGHTVESWDDGNPYYIEKSIDLEGRPVDRKIYAYHPNHEALARCIGNDSPHLCLSCGKEFMVDSRDPISACPKCKAERITHTWDLGEKPCPNCKKGKFIGRRGAIS
jgi:DNA-directed RNA polymerase subunit RPC12/RpoP